MAGCSMVVQWLVQELVVLGLGSQNGFVRSAPAVTDCHYVLPDRWSCGEREMVLVVEPPRVPTDLSCCSIETNTLGLLMKYKGVGS